MAKKIKYRVYNWAPHVRGQNEKNAKKKKEEKMALLPWLDHGHGRLATTAMAGARSSWHGTGARASGTGLVLGGGRRCKGGRAARDLAGARGWVAERS